MSDMRKKLIELLSVPIYPHLDADPAEVAADYLIANGVRLETETSDKASEKTSEWILVSERLPESGQHVLCVLKNGGLDICQWCSFDKSWSNDHDWCQEKDVTHWMPLPEPPKGE